MIKLNRRWLAAVIAVTVAADWITKAAVQRQLPLGDRRTILDGLLSFQHNFNPGIAWGWMTNLPANLRVPILGLLTLVAMAATVSIMRGTKDRWVHVAGALVLGGAVGNLGDRLMDGGVTDFIFVHFFPYIFNVADIAISIGGVLLAARMLFEPRERGGSAPTHA
jgi:signal peptidase II